MKMFPMTSFAMPWEACKTEEKNEPKIVGKMNIQMTLRKQYQLKEIESDEQILDFNDNSIKESKFTLGRKFFGFQKL